MPGIALVYFLIAGFFLVQSCAALPTAALLRGDALTLRAQTIAGCEAEPPKTLSAEKPKKIEKKGFSELALFLLGSGFALFVAILGWSDQIRSFNRDSLDLVNKFIDKTGIRRSDFRRFLKPRNPQERVIALTAIMSSGRLKTEEDVELSGLFNQLGEVSANLERLSSRKYDLTLCLTACMLGVGTISLFTTPTDQISLGFSTIPVELLLFLIPLFLILILLGIVIRSNHWEKQFNDQLTAISERT